MYEPLSDKTIRLFHINPDVGGVLDGKLYSVSMDEAPAYYALSHSWGALEQDISVKLEEGELNVCHGLATGIKRLRQLAADRASSVDPPIEYIWIDSICINLQDAKERADQVQLMADIYSGAFKTLVWLGDAFDGAEDAWDLVGDIYSIFRKDHPTAEVIDEVPGQIYSDEYHQSTELPGWDDPAWQRFKQLMEIRWFSRIWVVQEVALSAEDPIIIHGKHMHPWNELAWCTSWLRRKGYARLPEIPYQVLNIDAIRLLRANTVAWPLDALMSITQVKFHATDQRDKIFSLLGLALECREDRGTIPDALKPNYTISVEEVYMRAARYLLERNQSTAFFTRTRGTQGSLTRQARLHDLPGLPSWCPDWSDFNECNQRIRVSLSWINYKTKPPAFGWPTMFDASSGEKLSLQTTDDERVLQVEGARIDTVARVILFNEECMSKSEFEELFHLIMERIVPAALTLLPKKTIDNWITEFVKTTTVDHCQLHGRSWEQMLKDASKYLAKRIPPPDTTTDDMRDLLSRLEEQSAGGVDAQYATLVRNFGYNRSFLITEAGRMGVGPSDAAVGDVVTVILGGAVPYILREYPADPQASLLLGESYVYGLMNGEGLKIGSRETFRLM